MFARFARIVALTLLAWQAVVVQAHGHGWRPAAPVGVSVAAVAASTARATDAAIDCAICRVAAQAGHYVAPGPATFPAPLATPATPGRADAVQAQHSPRSHAWRSRAPPVALPA